MKIRDKNRKWIIHYHRLGIGHENFRSDWPVSDDGVSAIEAFFTYESTGQRNPTNCGNTMSRLTAGKKLHGINVDMWAKERADGMMSKVELKEICNDLPGLYEEVERMKVEYWPI